MSKNILVTGGAGFIGSHLVHRLVSEGNRVIVIDNLITTGDLRYLTDIIDQIQFINGDICNFDIYPALSTLLFNLNTGELDSLDEVYNLASPASVKLYTTFPELTFRTSTIGVHNVLEIVKRLGRDNCAFLETSTSECYGDPLEHPQAETYFGNVNTQCNRSCYDEGKRSAEVLCYLANTLYGLNTHIARLFNVYGPNNTDDRVMPTFISQAMKGEDITVYGSGSQTRSFCYVDDIVDGLIKLQRSNVHTPTNLGNPQEIPVIKLAEIINEIFGNKSKITFHPLPEFDPTRRCPVIDKAKAELGWSPSTDLKDGINKVINWMKENEGTRN
jgi:nucleoside-diphosphate-sugar epimerase